MRLRSEPMRGWKTAKYYDRMGEARVSMTVRCGCRTECRAGRVSLNCHPRGTDLPVVDACWAMLSKRFTRGL